MKSVIFTIKSNQSLRIGEVLQAELFECYSVSAKDAGLKPSADSLISDFHSVQFGVKGKSSLGFRLTFDGQAYQVSVPDLATASDWTGALMFLKTFDQRHKNIPEYSIGLVSGSHVQRLQSHP